MILGCMCKKANLRQFRISHHRSETSKNNTFEFFPKCLDFPNIKVTRPTGNMRIICTATDKKKVREKTRGAKKRNKPEQKKEEKTERAKKAVCVSSIRASKVARV